MQLAAKGGHGAIRGKMPLPMLTGKRSPMSSHDAPWYNDPEFDDDGHREQPERDVDAEYECLRERKLEEKEK